MSKGVIQILIIIIFLSIPTIALSEEARQLENTISLWEGEIHSLSENKIPTERINETLQETKTEFESQKQLEIIGRTYSYALIKEKLTEIEKIKTEAMEAKDRLTVFEEFYNTLLKEADLSEMEPEYQQIHRSFEEERFEETISLIDEGYIRLSDIHSSQTGASLFYNAASKSLKTFFFENWKIILLSTIIVSASLLLSWKTIVQVRLRKQLHHLSQRKQSINHLIKESQKMYFKRKKISESEYKIKLKKYEELIRDINRQIPLLKERIARVSKKDRVKQEKPNKTKQNQK